MIIGKHLSRRTLLRGMGVSIALPMLDSMIPAFAGPTKNPLRMVFNYVPNGIVMKDWTPAAGGTAFDLPRILQPMAAHRDNAADHRADAEERQRQRRRAGRPRTRGGHVSDRRSRQEDAGRGYLRRHFDGPGGGAEGGRGAIPAIAAPTATAFRGGRRQRRIRRS